MTTVRLNPAKSPCTRCGGVWFAKGLCRKCYWQDYNAAHRERQTEYNQSKREGRRRRRVQEGDGVPRCQNSWCGQRLPISVERDGRTTVGACDLCARFERGLCYTCGKPLPPVRWHRHATLGVMRRGRRSRWHKPKCFAKHNRARLREAQQRYRERNMEQERARVRQWSYVRWVSDRKAIKTFLVKQKRVRRHAAHPPTRQYAIAIKTRPCPEPGCENVMRYTTCPPKRCDSCWDRLAQQLVGGDA